MLDTKPARILICDDEPRLREMVSEYLSERGFDVSEAANTQERAARNKTDRPDLILLDIDMPGGATACRLCGTCAPIQTSPSSR